MVNMRGIVRVAVPLIVVGLLAAASVIPVVAATAPLPAAAATCDREPGRPSDKPPPPGQLKRRGVVGEIVGVDAETGTIIIEMKFGTVEMTVPEDFDLSDDMIGSRVAGLLEKEVSSEDVPSDETDAAEEGGEDTAGEGGTEEGGDSTATEGADTGEGGTEEGGDSTAEPLRSGSLLKLKMIPDDSSRTHETAVVTSQGEGTVEILDDSGNVETLEVEGEGEVQVVADDGEPAVGDGEAGEGGDTGSREGATTSDSDTEGEQITTVTEEIEDGTDAVLLVQCTDANAEPKVLGMQKADRVAERLERLEAKLAEEDAERAEKVAERLQEKEQRREERLEKTSANAPLEQKDKADRALGKAKGEIEESDKGKPDDAGNGDDKRKPDDAGKDKDDGSAGDSAGDEGDSGPSADQGGGGGGGSSGGDQGGGGGKGKDK